MEKFRTSQIYFEQVKTLGQRKLNESNSETSQVYQTIQVIPTNRNESIEKKKVQVRFQILLLILTNMSLISYTYGVQQYNIIQNARFKIIQKQASQPQIKTQILFMTL